MAACTGHERDHWILDGGSTIHVTNQLNNLSDLQEHHVAVGGAGGKTISTGKGTLTLNLALENGSLGARLVLREVWYLPDCACSAISQTLLNDSGIYYNDVTWDIYRLSDNRKLGYCPIINKSYMPLLYNEGCPTVKLTRCSERLYEETAPTLNHSMKTTHKDSLIRWHQRLAHLNFDSLKKHLTRLDISFDDDRDKFDPFICDACERSNIKKVYNRTPQERAVRPYQYVHTDMFGSIKPLGLLKERYFMTFTDDKTRDTEVFTAQTRNEWFSHLRTYYSRARTLAALERPVERIRTDYGTELRATGTDNWLLEHGIEFEPSAPYSQEENGVAESTGRELYRMARAMILAGGIPDCLWPEIVLAACHMKNLRPTAALQGMSPYEAMTGKVPDLSHLRVLGSTVYVLIHEEERIKSQKFAQRGKKGMLVGYDGTTIYRVFLEDEMKVIRIKDLRIFENPTQKDSTDLPEYQGDIMPDQGGSDEGSSIQSPTVSQPKRKRGRPRKTALQVTEEADQQVMATNTEDLATEETFDDARQRLRVLLAQFEKDRCKKPKLGKKPLAMLASWIQNQLCEDIAHYSVIAANTDIEEPDSYEQAMDGPYAPQWSLATTDEYNSLIQNGTWTLVKIEDVPENLIPLKGKWVFKIKRGVKGEILRFKARWVVKGYLQRYCIDYEQTYAAVVKPMAFRVLFAIAAYLDFEIEQMDVKTAFLYGDIDVTLYMHMPQGFEQPGMTCLLKKALYGLKQSPRIWYEKLTRFLLEKLGLKPVDADRSVLATDAGLDGPIVTAYVDDIKIMGKDAGMVSAVKSQFKAAFDMVDMGPISYYLGLKVERNRKDRIITISQPAYIDKVAARFGLDKAAPSQYPIREGQILEPNNKQATEAEIKRYQAMIGSVMFAMIETRPDISFAVSAVSRFAQNPSNVHFEAAKLIIRYLKTTRTRGIRYGGPESEFKVIGYSDADWGGDKNTRKSTSGFIFMFNGGAISWASRKQSTVALSSTESEYMALTAAAKEMKWLKFLLTDLKLHDLSTELKVNETEAYHSVKEGTPKGLCTDLKGDNQGAIALAHNPVNHARTKHIDIQYHFIREQVTNGTIDLEYIPTEAMVADGCTKALAKVKFQRFIDALRMTH